jgi:hypothetical protein
MDFREKIELKDLVEKHGLPEVLRELGELSSLKAVERRLKASDDDPEYRGWNRAQKRLLVLAYDLRYTYLRNVKRGLGIKEST